MVCGRLVDLARRGRRHRAGALELSRRLAYPIVGLEVAVEGHIRFYLELHFLIGARISGNAEEHLFWVGDPASYRYWSSVSAVESDLVSVVRTLCNGQDYFSHLL